MEWIARRRRVRSPLLFVRARPSHLTTSSDHHGQRRSTRSNNPTRVPHPSSPRRHSPRPHTYSICYYVVRHTVTPRCCYLELGWGGVPFGLIGPNLHHDASLFGKSAGSAGQILSAPRNSVKYSRLRTLGFSVFYQEDLRYLRWTFGRT
jgi:hypothetical protein